MSNSSDDTASVIFFLFAIGLGFYEYTANDPSTLKYEGLDGDNPYYGSIRFNVDVASGQVNTLSRLNNIILELEDCSIFDEDNWSCADYYVDGTVGKSNGEWVTPYWIAPINWDIHWKILEYFDDSLIFGNSIFDPIIEIYTASDQELLSQHSANRDKLNSFYDEIDSGAVAALTDEEFDLWWDAYLPVQSEAGKLMQEIARSGEAVSRLPLADLQPYGWRIEIPQNFSKTGTIRTEQTNQVNLQQCLVDGPLEDFCVFAGSAYVSDEGSNKAYVYKSLLTSQIDPGGNYTFRIFIDGMYQGQKSFQFYERETITVDF